MNIVDHETMRRNVWSSAYNATASANDCKKTDTAIRYADRALEAFDARFPMSVEDAAIQRGLADIDIFMLAKHISEHLEWNKCIRIDSSELQDCIAASLKKRKQRINHPEDKNA